MDPKVRGPGCGATRPTHDGPTRRYLESSFACWRLDVEVLAREYQDPARLAAHRLAVNAYAVKHPGSPSPQSARSVVLDLVALHLLFGRDLESPHAARALARFANARDTPIVRLEPPAARAAF